MKKSRFSEEQIATTLRQVDAGVPVAEVTRARGKRFSPDIIERLQLRAWAVAR